MIGDPKLAIFGEYVQGLCGDYNMIKQDDYRLRNGTVLEYTESGYDRTDSEYECAKSWLIKGDPGTFKDKTGNRAEVSRASTPWCDMAINS